MKKYPFFSAYDRFDCDPADCNDFRADTLDYDSETAEEFGSVEQNSDTESAEEFGNVEQNSDAESAEEFGEVEQNSDAESSEEFGNVEQSNDSESGVDSSFGVDTLQEDEQAATYDSQNDISELYEESESDSMDYSNDAEEAEAQDEVDVAEPSDGNGVCVNPEDETAATCDDCDCTIDTNCGVSDCGISDCDCTTRAQAECALDDYEIISDVLGSEKQLVKLYSTALCESSEDTLRDVIRANLTEAALDQYETFEYMQKRGLYPTEQADEQKICEAKQQFGKLC